MSDEWELPELSLQSCGQNEVSLLFQTQGIASPVGLSGAEAGGSFHQVGKILKKMHRNDLKAWETCHLREERHTLILQEKKIKVQGIIS